VAISRRSGHASRRGPRPQFFLKPPSSPVGHGDAIVIPRGAESVDYDGELAVVIKDAVKDIPEEESLDHVLGYCCFNDVTERSIVSKNIADLTLARGFDTFSCLGPYLVIELDPNDLVVATHLNGTVVQHDTTRNSVFSIQHILHYLSQCMTLCPGDVVATGTPQGIGPMKPGDMVEVEVSGIGKLRNIVRGE
jgi:2-keto-4-pentenoate hydratase/2-oxohepta-3-ene-1,7-dioic acid hydratase in catechol pathway